MLVLSRKAGEAICIRDDIVVTILDIRSDRVRLGIQAHSHVPVHREEVAQRIQSFDEKIRENPESQPPCPG